MVGPKQNVFFTLDHNSRRTDDLIAENVSDRKLSRICIIFDLKFEWVK